MMNPLQQPGADHLLRVAEDSAPQDWVRLRQYLSAVGISFDPDPPPRQFAGGFANLNYLVRIDGADAVLRRPPIGPLPPGAYDMGREARILGRLWQRFPLAPRAIHLCIDTSVLGAPFQLTEYRSGISFRAELPPILATDSRALRALANTLIDVLVDLHRVDPAEVGLEDLGRPQGFLARAVEGWIGRAEAAAQGWMTPAGRKLIAELAVWLRREPMPEHAPVLLHNDFKLDNLLLDPRSLRPVALLDWDQGTRGDGLFDLATLLSYWTEAGDPEPMQRLRQMPSALPGFPGRLEAAQRYAAAMGRDLAGFRAVRVLAKFKVAVIFMQLYLRWRAGGTEDPRYAGFGEVAEGLLLFAHDLAHGHTF
jgi:aminoglycoside phosphotransferase (APT) family kinase protein